MDNFKSIEGKVVIITGSTSGLGAAMAERFADNGAKVVVSGRNIDRGNAVVKKIVDNGGIATFVQCDVSKEDEVKALVDYAVKTYGKLHVMINNSGYGAPAHPVHDYTSEFFDEISDVLYKSVFLGTKYAVQAMIETNSKGCSIINTASGSGMRATEGLAFYTGGKHATVGLTKVAALDYAKHDITVNAICPGVFKTAIFDNISDEQMAVYNEMVPRGRIGDPIEVAWLALFLASDMARNINGTAIPIDSGFIAGDMNPASEWVFKDTREL